MRPHAHCWIADDNQECADAIKIVDIERKIKLKKKSPSPEQQATLNFCWNPGKNAGTIVTFAFRALTVIIKQRSGESTTSSTHSA